MIRGLLLDCDGTLIDSRQAILGFFVDLFATLALPAPDLEDPAVVEACMSMANDDLIDRFI